MAYDRKHAATVAKLSSLLPGDRVHYTGWRGDRGTGTFVSFTDMRDQRCPVGAWGHSKRDGVLVKRDFSADAGVIFRPFLGDGDSVMTDEMVAEQVIGS